MRKLLPSIFTLCFFIFSACSDNNEDQQSQRAKEITKVYRETNLKLTFNGKETKKRPIKCISVDAKVIDVNLMYLITGEKDLTFKKVPLRETADGKYTFQAEDSNDDRIIKIEGTISAGQNRILELNVAFESKTPLVGKWKLKPFTFVEGPLDVQILPGDMPINMYGIWGDDETDSKTLSEILNLIGGMVFGQMIDLRFEFTESGEMSAAWSSQSETIPLEPGKSKDGMLKFNTKNDNFYMAVALDSIKITKSELSNDDILAIIDLVQKTYNGLPLKIEYIDNENIALYVNRELMLPYIEAIVKSIKPTLASIDYGEMGNNLGLNKESVPKFADEIVRVMKEADKFDIKILLKLDDDKSANNLELPIKYTWNDILKNVNNIKK